MLTQLSRSSEARKIKLNDVSMIVQPRFEQTGSIHADTVASRLINVETSLNIGSQAPKEAIAKLVATAERMCFLMDTIQKPHEVRNSVSLNGEALD